VSTFKVRLDDIAAAERLMRDRALRRAQCCAKTQGVISVSSTLQRYNAAAAAADSIAFYSIQA